MVGKIQFSRFLEAFLPPLAAEVFEISSQKKVGEVDNLYPLTIGQRTGLGLEKLGYSVYVIRKDISNQRIWVEYSHPTFHLLKKRC